MTSEPRRIGEVLDAELWADHAAVPAEPQLIPDDAAIIKALAILRALQAAGLKSQFGFDLDEAKMLWAARLAPFHMDVLTAAITDWISSPGTDFPSVGDVETVAKSILAKRLRESPEEVARTQKSCSECEGLHWLRIEDRDPETRQLTGGHHMRPCNYCPEMKERSDLYDQGHWEPDHQDKGGCPKCWKYSPKMAHKNRQAERQANRRAS